MHWAVLMRPVHMDAVNTAAQLLSVESMIVTVIENVGLKARVRITVHSATL